MSSGTPKKLAQGYAGVAESAFELRPVRLQNSFIFQWHQDALHCWDFEQARRGSCGFLSCLAHGHGQISAYWVVVADQSTIMPVSLCHPFLYPRNRHFQGAWAIRVRTFHMIHGGCLNSTRASTKVAGLCMQHLSGQCSPIIFACQMSSASAMKSSGFISLKG